MTSSSRAGDSKLSFRLQTLHSFHKQEENIWDIGCDHGHLGLSFKDINTIKSIHFVDPSIKVIDVLTNKLKDAYISEPKVFIHHKEGQSLSIDSKNNLIFIAGMGGKEIGEIIVSLLPQLDQSSRIVISPHRKILELRALLNSLPVGLLSETVILEDNQYYQILELESNPAGIKVPLYGDSLWKSETGQMYLKHQISTFNVHTDLASRSYVQYLKVR